MIGRRKMGRLFLRPDAKNVEDPDHKILISHVAFLANADSFPSFIKRLDDLKIIHGATEDSGIAKSVFFNDPDGNSLEVTYYYKATPHH